MGGLIAKIVFKNGDDKLDSSTFSSLNDIPAMSLSGVQHDRLGDVVKDKKLYLVVNVASK
tara:strand:- start:547 stop:726 length:180 start_codon:yes stop_codon:yes gene_type:complete